MLGQMVCDPDGIEGNIPQLPGLGLMDIITQMTADKDTRQVEFSFDGNVCSGYEIHQGVTTATDGSALPDIVRSGNCMGTYIHGILDNSVIIEHVLSRVSSQQSNRNGAVETLSPKEFKDKQYDLLAEHVRKHVDIERLYSILDAGNDGEEARS